MFFDLEAALVEEEVAAVIALAEPGEVRVEDHDFEPGDGVDAPEWMAAAFAFLMRMLMADGWTEFSRKSTAAKSWLILEHPAGFIRLCFEHSPTLTNGRRMDMHGLRIKVHGDERAFELSCTAKRTLENITGCHWSIGLADEELVGVRRLKLMLLVMGRAYGRLTLHQPAAGCEIGTSPDVYPAEYLKMRRQLKASGMECHAITGHARSWYRSMLLVRVTEDLRWPVHLVQLGQQEMGGRVQYLGTVLWMNETRSSLRWACGDSAESAVTAIEQGLKRGPRGKA